MPVANSLRMDLFAHQTSDLGAMTRMPLPSIVSALGQPFFDLRDVVLRDLRRAGCQVFDVSPRGIEIGFLGLQAVVASNAHRPSRW